MNLKFLNEYIIRFFSLSLKKLIFTYWELKYEANYLIRDKSINFQKSNTQEKVNLP